MSQVDEKALVERVRYCWEVMQGQCSDGDGFTERAATDLENAIAALEAAKAPTPEPAGDVREALARRLYKAHVHATNSGPDKIDLSDCNLDEWFDSNAKMPLSGPPFAELWNAMADAAILARGQ